MTIGCLLGVTPLLFRTAPAAAAGGGGTAGLVLSTSKLDTSEAAAADTAAAAAAEAAARTPAAPPMPPLPRSRPAPCSLRRPWAARRPRTARRPRAQQHWQCIGNQSRNNNSRPASLCAIRGRHKESAARGRSVTSGAGAAAARQLGWERWRGGMQAVPAKLRRPLPAGPRHPLPDVQRRQRLATAPTQSDGYSTETDSVRRRER